MGHCIPWEKVLVSAGWNRDVGLRTALWLRVYVCVRACVCPHRSHLAQLVLGSHLLKEWDGYMVNENLESIPWVWEKSIALQKEK